MCTKGGNVNKHNCCCDNKVYVVEHMLVKYMTWIKVRQEEAFQKEHC